MSEQEKIQLFEDHKIRTAWDEDKEEWYFSVVDVIRALTGSENPRRYWSDLKRKLKEAESIEPTVVYQADEKQAEEIARQEKEIGDLKAREAARESETAAWKKRLAEVEQAKAEQPKTEIKGSALVIFKVKFESFQDILDDMNALLEEMSEEQKANCRKAVKVTFEESWN